MSIFRPASAGAVNLALLFVRVIAGVVFMAHGGQKLFTIGIPGVVEGFTQIGVPLPSLTAMAVTGLELGGGALLVVGLLTRVVAALLAIDMLGAFTLVHMRAGFFLPQGYEFVLLLFMLCLALVVAGAGRYSVDGAIGGRAP